MSLYRWGPSQLVCKASLVLLLRNGCKIDENLLEASFLILNECNLFVYPLRFGCLLELGRTHFDTKVLKSLFRPFYQNLLCSRKPL